MSISACIFSTFLQILIPFYLVLEVHFSRFLLLFTYLFRRSNLHWFLHHFSMVLSPLERWKWLFFLGKTIHFNKSTFSKIINFSMNFEGHFLYMFHTFWHIFLIFSTPFFQVVLGATFFAFGLHFRRREEPRASILEPFSCQMGSQKLRHFCTPSVREAIWPLF